MTKQDKVWQFVRMAKGLLAKAAELECECEQERIEACYERARQVGREHYSFGAHELDHDPLGRNIERIVEAIDERILGE